MIKRKAVSLRQHTHPASHKNSELRVGLLFAFMFFRMTVSNFSYSLFLLIRFTTTFTMTSFSSVRLSAIISVRATRVLSAMRLVPSSR